MDCNPPGASVHGILQARILEWVSVPSSGDLHPRERNCLMSPSLGGGFFTTTTTQEAPASPDILSNRSPIGPFKSCFHFRDCPGGPVVENPPSSVGEKGLIPGQGARSHIPGANKPMYHNERNLCTATRRPHAARKTLRSPPPCKNCSHFNELLPHQIREGLLSTYHQQSKIKS